MHRLLAVLSLSLAMLAPASARAGLDVVATVPDLAALAREIGGAHASVRALSLATQDPHFVDPKPSLTLVVNRADLLVAVGMELEVGWLPKLQTGARNPKVQTGGRGYLECAQLVDALGVPTGPVDRSMGDIHPSGNPHYLRDPRRAEACARGMAARMAALDPAHAEAYRANLAAFVGKLRARRAAWERRLARYRGAPVITYHTSWVYLTDWLGLVEVAHLEPKPGIRPSPTHVARVIGLARKRGVKVLLQESYYPSNTGTLVARKIGARLVDLPGAASFRQGQSYLEYMDKVVSALVQALESSAS